MDKVITLVAGGIGALLGTVVTIIAIMLISPLLGAAFGWVVGWFFGPTILYVLGQLGLHGVEMWQLGLTFGFLSSFISMTRGKANAKSE